MKLLRRSVLVVVVLVLCGAASGQSTCSLAHPDLGVHICFPPDNRSEELPPILHISAQINAPPGQLIKEFTILVDNSPVGQELERVATGQVSVEGNLGAPLTAGQHIVSVRAQGIGEARARIVVRAPESIIPCDPVTNVPQWVCISRPVVRGAKEMSSFAALKEQQHNLTAAARYQEYERGVLAELEALQLDTMDVTAFDSAGNLYVASHVNSDVEVRKYSPGGQKLEFATIINSCGPGFTALDAIDVDDRGEVWIAGHSRACFRATEHAFHKETADTTEAHAFLMRVSARPGAFPPLEYFTYLSDSGGERIRALKVNPDGSAYVAGTVTSAEFPHQTLLTLDERKPQLLSFAAVFSSDGSALLHSTLLRGILADAVHMDAENNVFIAGRTQRSRPIASSRPQNSTPGPLSATSNSYSVPVAAALAPDLSGVRSVKVLDGSQAISSLFSISATSTGDLVALAAAIDTPSRSQKIDGERGQRFLYGWSATGHVCSQVLRGGNNPSLVEAAAMELFAKNVSDGICTPANRPSSVH